MEETELRRLDLYFPQDMLSEIEAEARRQQRTLSWLLQRAWALAQDERDRVRTPGEAPAEG
jgi:uncharacterized small protein (TIGR04563 family)